MQHFSFFPANALLTISGLCRGCTRWGCWWGWLTSCTWLVPTWPGAPGATRLWSLSTTGSSPSRLSCPPTTHSTSTLWWSGNQCCTSGRLVSGSDIEVRIRIVNKKQLFLVNSNFFSSFSNIFNSEYVLLKFRWFCFIYNFFVPQNCLVLFLIM